MANKDSFAFECKILDLHFRNQKRDFVWIKSSAQQDTLVAKYENGLHSILKIKAGGLVSHFVLDPNLSCVYWDDEEASETSQKLCAQTSSRDIILYIVNEDGVTVCLSISYSQIKSAVQEQLVNDDDLQLVGCDRGNFFLWNGENKLFCMKLETGSFAELRCILPLPQSSKDTSVGAHFRSFQIINGSVVIFDFLISALYIYSIAAETCVCQVNLKPLSIETESIISWKMSFDLSVVTFLRKDWTMLSVNILGYGKHDPENVVHLDNKNHQSFNMEYMSYHLCCFGDAPWKRQVVEHHMTSSDSHTAVGFNVENKKKSRKETTSKNQSHDTFKVMLTLPEDGQKSDWSLVRMEASSSILTLLIKKPSNVYGGNSRLTVCFANFTDKTVKLYDEGDKSFVVLSERPSCSHLLLSDDCLKFISPFGDLQKDQLISWMMSYSGPPGADSLCQANQWTRTSVPLQAIEASLQQRQMDILTFYFKSKQDLFSLSSHHLHGTGLASDIRQIQDTLNLVTTTILTNLQEPQAKIFLERLLSVTLEFIYSLLEDARQYHLTNPDKEIEIQEACTILVSYMPSLRKSMLALQYKKLQSSLSYQDSDLVKKQSFNKDNSKASVENAIKENRCSHHQAHLMSQDNIQNFHFRDLVNDVLKIVQYHLEKNDISSCQQILNNLGCNVSSILWSLFQYNNSRTQQKFLTSQLSAAAALNPSQRQLVYFLDHLYQAYPSESFTLAVKNKTVLRVWGDKDPISKLVKAKDAAILSHCGEISPVSSLDIETPGKELYVAVNLAWVSQWSQEMRKSVLTDAHFISSEHAEDFMEVLKADPDSSWQFLMSHNLIGILLPLMESTKADDTFPWPDDATDFLKLGWSHFQKDMAKQLLRLKKLNLELMVQQKKDLFELLPLVGGPMQKSHPFNYSGQIFLKQHHIDTITQFVSAGLQLPFWMYCTMHSINPSELNINHGGTWFPVFQAFYSIPRQPKDKNILLSASLLAAADLWSLSPEEVTIEKMLEKNQGIAAVGTLCYMTEGLPSLTSASLKKSLQQYPQLLSALTIDGIETLSKYNASVYQLLVGSSLFDLRRLFGWQTTNTFAGEDSPKVMPHFSEPQQTALHSRHHKLSFPYYLKHGRPVYAYLSFLSEELDRSEVSLSQKRIHQACGASLWIACQNFNTPSITSACVIFVELLGQDSAHVRTMLNVGRILLTHKHKCVGGSAESRQEQLKTVVSDIVSDLLACVRSSRHYGNKLVRSLEAAIEEEIKLEVIGRCSYEAALKWMIVLMLCEQLSLPLSTCFLKACAETDNWLMFVWFSQLHQYPTHQLQNLLQSFRSPNLRDHLHYVINNADSRWFSTSSASSSNRNAASEKKSSVTQRSFLYSKIGVQKSRDRASTSSDEEDDKLGKASMSSFTSRLKQSEFNDCEMQESTAPDDVFRMLFYCQSMPSKWRCLLSAAIALRNPLFAELAACSGCPALPSICGWLLASMPSETKQSFINKHGQNVSKWTIDQLHALIETVLMLGLEDSLATAFIILQPLSPLLPFFCFITEIVKRRNYSAGRTFIDQFKDAMATFDLRTNTEKTSDTDLPMIGDRSWFEKVTYLVIKHELKSISSLYEAKHLLEILDKKNICLVFSFDVLDFGLLNKIVTLLHANSVPCPQLGALLTSGTKSEKFISECEEGVNYLISCGKFSEAHELSKLAGIGREGVTISQLKEEKERLVSCGMWTAKYVRIQYWKKSKMLLLQAECSTSTCSHFYQNELQGTSIEFERALLCQHWIMVLTDKNDPEVITIKETVFRNMWRHRIAAKMSSEDQEPLDEIFDSVDVFSKKHGDLKADLIQLNHMTHYGSDIQGDLNTQELEVLDSLMGSYLDDGRISDCTNVATVFGHYNQDLAIIQTCISLAVGQSSIDSIEPAMKRLLVKSSCQRTRHVSVTISRSLSVGSINSGTSTLTDSSLTCDTNDIISVMEKLYSHCIKGSQVCLRIITCYKISQVLGVEYKQIVIDSEFESLRKLLKVDYPNKFIIARDFLATSGLSENEIIGFVTDSIVHSLKTLVQKDTDSLADLGANIYKNEKTFNPADGMEIFAQYLKLTDNTALLGNCILQSVATLLTCQLEEMSSSVLTIQTELIIMAHECYTVSSNMEGISHVLRAARVCCDCLAEAAEYNLMIRLLIGVGRYSEMQYIFHALQQNHQFELLLRKGMDREDKLKVAILDYLKRYQPDDSDAYTMVALKFTMYRDIAAMLEACGHRSLNQFKGKLLENSKETQELLKKCLQYFQDAAESYVKDSSIRKAQHCVKLARLLSLQMQLLPSGMQVVELSKEQVAHFVNTHTRFIEAMVVSDAYDKHVDWSEAVYNNVVVNGDMRYLQEMKLHVHITASLVEDVLKRYKQSSTKSSSSLQPIKKLLSHCKDVQLQYRLATELGLGDEITSLLKGDTGCFLQDVSLI
ncbi:spatacsin [Biomphalaria glabrata]